MSKLLWSFSVCNPQIKHEEPNETAPAQPQRVSRFAAARQFNLPSQHSTTTTVFQVYTQERNNNHIITDYVEEIERLIESADYDVTLVATTSDGKMFSTNVKRRNIGYFLVEGFPEAEQSYREVELADSLVQVLFGTQSLRPPPVWLTTRINGDGGSHSMLVLEIRRGYRLRGAAHWTAYEAMLLGEIPLQAMSGDGLEGSNTAHNMLIQGTAQLMGIKTQMVKQKERERQLEAQLEEFLQSKTLDEADLLEKMLILLNKKKEKLEQLRQGVDIPDDDDAALYEFYAKVGEYSVFDADGRMKKSQDGGFGRSREPHILAPHLVSQAAGNDEQMGASGAAFVSITPVPLAPELKPEPNAAPASETPTVDIDQVLPEKHVLELRKRDSSGGAMEDAAVTLEADLAKINAPEAPWRRFMRRRKEREGEKPAAGSDGGDKGGSNDGDEEEPESRQARDDESTGESTDTNNSDESTDGEEEGEGDLAHKLSGGRSQADYRQTMVITDNNSNSDGGSETD